MILNFFHLIWKIYNSIGRNLILKYCPRIIFYIKNIPPGRILWGKKIKCYIFVLCLVYTMLPVSLDCPFLLPVRYSLTFICPVSCVLYVASFSGLSFFITPSVFSNMYLSCVLCTLCCQFLWIVFFFNYPFGIL